MNDANEGKTSIWKVATVALAATSAMLATMVVVGLLGMANNILEQRGTQVCRPAEAMPWWLW